MSGRQTRRHQTSQKIDGSSVCGMRMQNKMSDAQIMFGFLRPDHACGADVYALRLAMPIAPLASVLRYGGGPGRRRPGAASWLAMHGGLIRDTWAKFCEQTCSAAISTRKHPHDDSA